MNISKIIEVGASDFYQCWSKQFIDSGAEIHLFEPNPIFYDDLINKLSNKTNVTFYSQAISNKFGHEKFYCYGYSSFLKGQVCLGNSHMDLDGKIADYNELLKPLSIDVPTVSTDLLNDLITENTYLSINSNGAEKIILENLVKLPYIIRMAWYGHNEVQWNAINYNRNILNTLNYLEIVRYKNKLGTFYELEYIRR